MSRWIKVDVATPMKGEVLAIARDCHCTHGDAFLAWFRVWAWLDELTTDGRLPGVTPAMMDGEARLQGFAASMARSGWMTFDEDGCTVTNWCKHNGSCAKRRAQQAVRMAQLRDEQRNAGQVVRPCPRRPSR